MTTTARPIRREHESLRAGITSYIDIVEGVFNGTAPVAQDQAEAHATVDTACIGLEWNWPSPR